MSKTRLLLIPAWELATSNGSGTLASRVYVYGNPIKDSEDEKKEC